MVEIMENYCKVCGDTYDPMFGCRCDVTRAPSLQTDLSSSSIKYGCFSMKQREAITGNPWLSTLIRIGY
jgi:hypothetical protein